MKLAAGVAILSLVASPSFAGELKCHVYSAISTKSRSPTVEVPFQPGDVGLPWTVTGGGCELTGLDPGPDTRTDNGPITASKPLAAGWYCRAMDPPNIPLTYSVTGYVVYCRITQDQ